ncbi:MAG: beta-lactamase family protein [Clostridia bacterium]|nr:beta-lactamase family protein [Clostridia bacterium]MBQ8720302.1 beta-lactamase family protein [Clostridia bacterium]
MFEMTKKFCDSFLERGLPGFDLAVYHKGECILRYMNGYSDSENRIEMNGKERYNIYSCSKPITCTAAMQLWEKGLFSLEDRLSDYLPEFERMTVKCEGGVREAKNPILIKHLFEMTAGFSYNCSSPNLLLARAQTGMRSPTREAMKYLAKEPLEFEPGDRWNYSLCHDVLAAVVEVISGQKFEDYVKENIFIPLEMLDSTFMLADEELDSIAEQYRFEGGRAVNVGKRITTYKLGSEYASGGAGCISTVDDYMKFLEALRIGDKVLKRETIAFMATPRLSKEQEMTYWSKDTHGYGLGIRCPRGDERYTDFGWGGAACAHLTVDPENELSIYFGAHLLSSPVQGLRSMIYRFVKAELFGESLDDIYALLKGVHNYNLTY